ncbi:ABC transporter permease [Lactobacillus sp. CC-MHH1034]|uniref:ABC transporter permease n=1 Tax=Agrilactobacillus fermenti TaxID=2586909 RepID=UPI001E5201D3|nr:ABC transporter permease [Agrilactobacillus fermenti]MCD2256388.1 ABC transporter permease [Agrilactobacillus fermenti]
MTIVLKREFYKLTKRKITWIAPVLMLAFMIFIGTAMGSTYDNLLIMSCFDSGDCLLLVLVIIGSTVFSAAFQSHTILTELYKAPSRLNVYGAKLLVLLLYNFALHLLAIVWTCILSWVTFKQPVQWFKVYQHHQPLIVNLLTTTGLDILVGMLIIGFVFLTSCLIRSNAVVTTFNMIIIFMGPFVTRNLIGVKPQLASIIKWNPLAMTNLTQQYYNYVAYHPVTLLRTDQLLWGTLGYGLLLITLGYLAFRKRQF